jgi:hypothetical protein
MPPNHVPPDRGGADGFGVQHGQEPVDEPVQSGPLRVGDRHDPVIRFQGR